MWKFGLWVLVGALVLPPTINATTIEVKVHGLTCAFCVDSLQRQLKKVPDIERVDVSLKNNKVRIVSSAEQVDIDRIRQIVIDSGFTPVEIRTIADED